VLSRLRLVVGRLVAPLVLLALRLSGRRAGLVLVYHALAERTGDPVRELVPAHGLALFEAQVRHLRARYRVVPGDKLAAAVAGRRRLGRFPVAITFDDDLASHAELAAPALSRLGAPATFFLTGATLDGPFTFWWQHRRHAAPSSGAGEDVHEVGRRLEAMSAEQRDAVVDELGGLSDQIDEPGLRAEQVRELVAAGFAVGFHTLRHERLIDLDDVALRRALSDGRERLESVVGYPLTTLAYPYGKADERVARAAASAGFDLGFTGRYEAVRHDSDPLLLGRIEPTFASSAHFAAQLVRLLVRASPA
jgi:peptidoglycan/xylan/chitin deacetylase (PgdA/CDA1 family)